MGQELGQGSAEVAGWDSAGWPGGPEKASSTSGTLAGTAGRWAQLQPLQHDGPGTVRLLTWQLGAPAGGSHTGGGSCWLPKAWVTLTASHWPKQSQSPPKVRRRGTKTPSAEGSGVKNAVAILTCHKLCGVLFRFSSFGGHFYELIDSNMIHEFQSAVIILTEALVVPILGRRNPASCLLSFINVNPAGLDDVLAFP